MQIFVKTLTGKTIVIETEPRDKLIEVKRKIQRSEGIPAETQILSFRGKDLCHDDSALIDYKIGRDETLHLRLRMSGGGGGPAPAVKFSDLKQPDEVGEFSKHAPAHRAWIRGLNLEARCENAKCKAFKLTSDGKDRRVIVRIGFGNFDVAELVRAEHKCPICRSPTTPIRFAAADCFIDFDGEYTDDDEEHQISFTRHYDRRPHLFAEGQTEYSWMELTVYKTKDGIA
jgi:ubiquitin-large subunit ribosomal protein L40e